MLKDASIKTKITSIVLAISLLSIFLVLSILIVINQEDEKQSLTQNMSVLAKLIGDRSNAALTFDDIEQAESNLKSLEANPLVILSCIYNDSGNLFASYVNTNITDSHKTVNVPITCDLKYNGVMNQTAYQFEGSHLLVYEPITFDGDFIGTMHIRSSLVATQEHLVRYLLIALGLLVTVGFLAAIFAAMMQRIISEPLLHLTQVAKHFGENKDYSSRAKKYGNDEVGDLVDSFNSMLQKIGEQKEVLIAATHQANAASEVKGQFLANMSHELRTPINGLLGMNELLLESGLNTEQREYALLAAQSGTVLLDTVNQILDLASIESSGLKLESSTVVMREFFDDIGQIFSSQLATKKLDLVIQPSPSIPSELSFDLVRMRQVFINLIANAIKFTSTGGVHVVVDWNNDRLVGTVEDSGEGIPKEAQQRIFESFQQVDNSSTRKFGGTGLGLSICSEICKAMNGYIKLDRSSAAGSCFLFEVDAIRQSEACIETAKFENQNNILIVADVFPLGNWLEDVLTTHGADYQIAHTIGDALPMVTSSSVIIVDAKFGEGSLREFIKNANRSQRSDTRFIWLTWVGKELSAEAKSTTDIPIEMLYKPINVYGLSKSIGLAPYVDQPPVKVKSQSHILLVDDNPINRTAMEAQLRRAGLQVDIATNGLEAVAACRKQSYALVLMDVQMPEMDGLEATKIIRLEQRQHAPPIVGVSAHVMEENITAAYKAGMDDYLCKPVREGELIKKVGEYVA